MTIPSLVIASTWMNMGGAILIYLAALQNIPGELYEAAELDGAGILRRIWHVTIPQTRLILSLMFLLQVVATMQLFIEPFILAGGDGVENHATSIVYLMYQHAFTDHDLNGAAALGVMLHARAGRVLRAVHVAEPEAGLRKVTRRSNGTQRMNAANSHPDLAGAAEPAPGGRRDLLGARRRRRSSLFSLVFLGPAVLDGHRRV